VGLQSESKTQMVEWWSTKPSWRVNSKWVIWGLCLSRDWIQGY